MATRQLLFCLVTSFFLLSALAFDVRNHLSSATRYDFRDTSFASLVDNNIVPPPGCSPVHINLVARHGTRAPTKKRIRELDELEAWIKSQLEDKIRDHTLSSSEIYDWLWKWESPWKGKTMGGELVPFGEDEMFDLASRFRKAYPDLFAAEYHPEIYKLVASQVPRASASAVAFGLGLFAGTGGLGSGGHRAFAVITESRANDTHLRFHESCHAYKAEKKVQKPVVESLKENIYSYVASSLLPHVHLNLSGGVISSLWLLCKQEAAVLDMTNQACSMFTPEQVKLLEWADDLELHHLKGYGKPINYQMATSLLRDVVESMQNIVTAYGGSGSKAELERARFRFAHAETLIPFSCLLGLFNDGDDLESAYNELPNMVPLRPPQERRWRGSKVAPFGANTALVLHECTETDVHSGGEPKLSHKFLVQALYNEQAVVLPGCGDLFCPFEVFKEKVAAQYLRHSYHAVCSVTNSNDPEFSELSQMLQPHHGGHGFLPSV